MFSFAKHGTSAPEKQAGAVGVSRSLWTSFGHKGALKQSAFLVSACPSDRQSVEPRRASESRRSVFLMGFQSERRTSCRRSSVCLQALLLPFENTNV